MGITIGEMSDEIAVLENAAKGSEELVLPLFIIKDKSFELLREGQPSIIETTKEDIVIRTNKGREVEKSTLSKIKNTVNNDLENEGICQNFRSILFGIDINNFDYLKKLYGLGIDFGSQPEKMLPILENIKALTTEESPMNSLVESLKKGESFIGAVKQILTEFKLENSNRLFPSEFVIALKRFNEKIDRLLSK